MLQLTILLSLIAACTASCNQTCGELRVPYPFGFSPSCSIQLSCNSSNSRISLSGFPLQNFTANSTFVLNISADCSRNFTSVSKFFSTNYALTRRNGLLLRDCPSSDTSLCLLPTTAVSQMSHQLSSCNPKGDNLTCLFNNTAAGMYLEKDDVLNESLCQNLFTSVMYEPNAGGQTVLALGIVEIGWWMTGDCRCAANATCTRVNRSEVEGKYWCRCDEGFIGDGYANGTGCRGVSTVVALIIVIVFLIICTKIQRYGSYKKSMVQERIESIMKQNGSLAPKMYKYAELKKITNCFSDELGKGGFGKVYKGSLKNGFLVAVKLLHNSSHTGEEFVNEVMSISKTSHVNIVALLGFCIHKSKRALIYEYMSNGSLDKYIHSENPKANFGWEKLHGIAIGVARGLEYLHRGCSTRIVHFDIKPQNILLDEDFCPKIADFGLAKLCPPKESIMSLAEMRGTIGYIAPEVFSRTFGDVSTKSDVYSYGMMVLEMVGGRRNSKLCVENSSEAYFPHWIHDRLVKGNEIELCEATTTETEEIARKMALIGLWCTQTNPTNRPSMSRVVEMFERSPDELEMPPKPLLASPPHGMMTSICSTF